MKKKILAVMLAVGLITVGLTGCAAEDGGAGNEKTGKGRTLEEIRADGRILLVMSMKMERFRDMTFTLQSVSAKTCSAASRR